MKTHITKRLGIATVLLGLAWIIMLLSDPESRRFFVEPETRLNPPILKFVLIIPAIVLPAGLALFYGIKVFIRTSITNVARSIGTSLFVIAGILTTVVDRLSAPYWGDGTVFMVLMPVLCFAAVGIYVVLALYVLRKTDISFHGIGDLFSRPFLLLLAGLVVGCLSGLLQTYVLGVMSESAKTLVTIGNLLLAFGVYQILLRMLGKKSLFSHASGPTHA